MKSNKHFNSSEQSKKTISKSQLAKKPILNSHYNYPKAVKNNIFAATIHRVPRPTGHLRKRRKDKNDDPLISIIFSCIFKAKASHKHRKRAPSKVLVDSGTSRRKPPSGTPLQGDAQQQEGVS